MKPIYFLTIIALSLSSGIVAQVDQQHSFFETMAARDVLHEQLLHFQNEGDEHDFWNDQLQFETSLQRKNALGYQTYVSSKKNAYLIHQLKCDDSCNHSDFYYKKMTIYVLREAQELSTVANTKAIKKKSL